MPYGSHPCPLSVNYGARRLLEKGSTLDFHHDWKAWSGKERVTVVAVAAVAVGLTLRVVAWVVV